MNKLPLLILLFFMGCAQKELELLPLQHPLRVTLYDDSGAPGGNSEILKREVSDSSISCSYRLNNGFTYPYVGMELQLMRQGVPFDARKYDSVTVTFHQEGVDRLVLFLGMFVESVSDRDDSRTQRPFEQFITPKKGSHSYTFALKDFVTPEWWLKEYLLTSTPIDLSNLSYITLCDANYTNVDDTRHITITGIRFHSSSTDPAIVIIAGIALITLIIISLWLKKREKPLVLIPAETIDKNQHRAVRFIVENYGREDLQCRTVSDAAAMDEQELRNYFSVEFNCSVEEFITRLRINEVKRLLKESNGSIADIAKVTGLGDSEKLYRVFTKAEGVSPSAYRKENLQ